jgi:hypothetical protein
VPTFQDTVAALASSQLPSLISTIEVRSNFSPPVVINVADALKPGPPGPGQRVAGAAQPTVIFSGKVGNQVLAPFGPASPDAWKLNLLFLGGVAAVLGAVAVMSIYHVGVFKGRKRSS